MEKTILITGAVGGIGRAISLEYAKENCTLILCDYSETNLLKVKVACQQRGAEVDLRVFNLESESQLSEK